jgi:hypothetical protein
MPAQAPNRQRSMAAPEVASPTPLARLRRSATPFIRAIKSLLIDTLPPAALNIENSKMLKRQFLLTGNSL